MGRASRKKRERNKRRTNPVPMGVLPAVSRAMPPQQGPLSEALVKIIEPYQNGASSLETYRLLVTLGALAWNLTILPEHKRNLHIGGTMSKMDFPDRDDWQDLLRTLVQRKERLFPHDGRIIVDSQVTTTPTGYYITVASARAEGRSQSPRVS